MASKQHRAPLATSSDDVQDGGHTETGVGLLHWAGADIRWLEDLLGRSNVRCLPVPLPSVSDGQDVVMEESWCVILYHSQTSHRSIHEVQKYLDQCNMTKGSSNVLIICDEEPDKDFTKRNRDNNILTIIEAEINGRTTGKTETEPAKTLMAKVEAIRGLLQDQERSSNWKNKDKQAIGVFSRSDESDYSWLLSLLHNQNFRPCYISNNGYRRFREDVSMCKFGILYHTKNRGRVNVTDVTDSLYDEELNHLSSVLGKRNVIVVIDDLEDSSDDVKTRILKTQPSIEELSCALFLFSGAEKTPECIQHVASRRAVNTGGVTEKLDKIRNFIKPRETPRDVNRLRRELMRRIDNYKLSHGYTRILLQIFKFEKLGKSSFINSITSALTSKPQGHEPGSSVQLRSVISMIDNAELDHTGCRFYLHVGNIILDGNFKETFGNLADKIIRAKDNGDLCVPIFISREQKKLLDLKKTLQEKNIHTGLPPVFILNKIPSGSTGTALGDKDIKVIDLGTEPAAESMESLEKDWNLLNILKEVLDNVDKKLQAPLDKEEEHKKLQVALLTIVHELFIEKKNNENKLSCNIM